jgi:hypothetical protein
MAFSWIIIVFSYMSISSLRLSCCASRYSSRWLAASRAALWINMNKSIYHATQQCQPKQLRWQAPFQFLSRLYLPQLSLYKFSPVRIDWSIESSPLISLASAGTISPRPTEAISPGTISSTPIVTQLPSRNTLALIAKRFFKASSALCEPRDCIWPIIVFIVRRANIIPASK